MMSVDRDRHRISDHPMIDDADFERVRRLLIDTHAITPTGFNWEVRRWEGWRFYRSNPAWDLEWNHTVRLWQTEGGDLVGAAHAEGTGDVHLQVHPEFRHLEEQMIAWAEDRLAVSTGEGTKRRLDVFAFDYDTQRCDLLLRRGYESLPGCGFTYRLRFDRTSPPASSMAEGYTMRTTRPADAGDCHGIAALLNAAFNRDFHTADEYRVFTTHARCFHAELDLVAVAPDGSLAAYVGAPYDEVNRCGILEPVCTHPDHLRRGLARALMCEALRRLQALGAGEVRLGTGDAEAANRAYESVGFTDRFRERRWRRVI